MQGQRLAEEGEPAYLPKAIDFNQGREEGGEEEVRLKHTHTVLEDDTNINDGHTHPHPLPLLFSPSSSSFFPLLLLPCVEVTRRRISKKGGGRRRKGPGKLRSIRGGAGGFSAFPSFLPSVLKQS